MALLDALVFIVNFFIDSKCITFASLMLLWITSAKTMLMLSLIFKTFDLPIKPTNTSDHLDSFASVPAIIIRVFLISCVLYLVPIVTMSFHLLCGNTNCRYYGTDVIHELM